ncbi:hypothetical protein AKJ09_03920 [Labilithrix luteola]|uniref:Glycosyltransferase RgtA/B/C/D-like domain-containing protein n=1 Tax=Labilithrix luteola TaxID=1391654 RepID=A0A0K1PV68_9BACT|nr:hypothetical protein [Labilithrix luteola]AKU97256.1 hypothetical protein AKJ09_03920 [Labilithrix luteola]
MGSSSDARGARRFDALRALAPGMLVALPLSFALPRALHRASWATLGRDQGIFQYVAWAVGQGDLAYRDVRDVNGPLVPLLHLVLLWLGGDDEHRFRVLDLLFTGLTAAFAGATFWTLAPHAADASRRFRGARAISAGLAAWGVVSAQYVAYGFWDSAQRESFFDWFLLGSLGCFLLASQALAEARSRRGLLFLAAAGAMSVMPWFGKPTYALFTVAELLVLLLDRQRLSRLARGFVFGLGGVAGALVPVLFLLARGDVGAWLRISFKDVPAMYRFIWPRTPSDILFSDLSRLTWLALASSGGVILFVLLRRLPVRALVLATTPLCGLVSVVAQAKGFIYHFHPVTVGSALCLVALALSVWDWADSRSSLALRGVSAVVASALALVLGWRMSRLAWRAPYPPHPNHTRKRRTRRVSRSTIASTSFRRPFVTRRPSSMRTRAKTSASRRTAWIRTCCSWRAARARRHISTRTTSMPMPRLSVASIRQGSTRRPRRGT